MQEEDRPTSFSTHDLTTQIKVYQIKQTTELIGGGLRAAPSEKIASDLKSSLINSSETQWDSVESRVTISERFSFAVRTLLDSSKGDQM
jgi:hypothetical protein